MFYLRDACLEAGFESEKSQFFGETRCFLKGVPGGTAKKKNEVSPKKRPFLAQRLVSKQALSFLLPAIQIFQILLIFFVLLPG